VNVKAYHDAINNLVRMFTNEELPCSVEEEAARIFGTISSTTDDDTCQAIGVFVVDASALKD